MSGFNNPGNAGFNQYDAGPHAGTPTDPDAHIAADPLDRRIRRVITNRWTALAVVCLVVAAAAYLSLT
jgi:hypothetical protein